MLEVARKRVFGFEILPAPFVIAHLQISLYLERIGAPMLDGSRAAVYLTNALTGWSAGKGRQVRLWEGLKEERDQSDQVKRKAKVLVVLGNPPYNAFAGVQPDDEQDSVNVYKEGLRTLWHVQKFNLDELYVRFMRLAEWKIVEQSRRGVVCYVSNASYAADKSFVVLRERFLREFDTIAIDNCNGDSRETGKLTPDGKPDHGFTDVPAGARYNAALKWAEASGLLDGFVSGARFKPGRVVTRGQLADVLFRLASTEAAWPQGSGDPAPPSTVLF